MNIAFLGTVGAIDRATRDGHCVEFNYQVYGADRKPVLRTDEHGNAKLYRIDPYGMVTKRGEYYLIGWPHDRKMPKTDESDDNHTNLRCFVIDRIVNIRETNEPIAVSADSWDVEGVPMESSKDHVPFTPAGFARSRPHMTMGPMIDADLVVNEGMLTVLYEWFESAQVKRLPEDEWIDGKTSYRVHVKAPEMGLLFWVLQYQSWFPTTVIEPEHVRARLVQLGEQIVEHHSGRWGTHTADAD